MGRDLTGIKVERMACQRYESGGAQCVRGSKMCWDVMEVQTVAVLME